MYGILQLPWWGDLLVVIAMIQVTIFAVTLYLHRCQTHYSLDLHPIISHFFRFWLWITTGMQTKEWVAVHRKHHAKVETVDDPHSPQIKGFWKVFLEGAELYRQETKNKESMERYGKGTPDDWIEKNIYTRYNSIGIYIMLALNIILFGAIGITIWAVQMMWVPFWAAGVVNGVGHYAGYRNFEPHDASENFFPIGFFIGGEELHNNHHTYATSAKFSVKWWEFDIGWLAIKILEFFKLAKPRRVQPKIYRNNKKNIIDIETFKALLVNRYQVLENYNKKVLLPVFKIEYSKSSPTQKSILKNSKKTLFQNEYFIHKKEKEALKDIFNQNKSLETVYKTRIKLQKLWEKNLLSNDELVKLLQNWCNYAANTKIIFLNKFVKEIKSYVLATNKI